VFLDRISATIAMPLDMIDRCNALAAAKHDACVPIQREASALNRFQCSVF
jgi:hypothetical protein